MVIVKNKLHMNEPLPTESYQAQQTCWPDVGHHILAHFDDSTIIVYQAFTQATGNEALRRGRFGTGFGLHRTSWLKTSFLWMMHRSAWGLAARQECVLAIRVSLPFFDGLVRDAIPTGFEDSTGQTKDQWQSMQKNSDVLIQWDPDRGPMGEKKQRRAIQLGLRGHLLRQYAADEILEIIDMTVFVSESRKHKDTWQDGILRTPRERVYAMN